MAREGYELIKKRLSTFKESIELKVQQVHDLITSKVKNIDGLFMVAQKNVDFLLLATRTLVEDIQDFNVDYKVELEEKNGKDEAV